MKYIITSVIIISFTVAADVFAAMPVVSISSDLTVSVSEDVVDIPVYISGALSNDIGGFILRLDYTDNLSNPRLITIDTLTQGKDVQSGPPTDGMGGKFAIGLIAGFAPKADGLMLIVRLDVSTDFERSDIIFLLNKSRLHTSGFQEIDTSFQSGHLFRPDPLLVTLVYCNVEFSQYPILRWKTEINIDTEAFRIWRREESDSTFTLHSDPIQTTEGFMQGALYTWYDMTADPGKQYQYKLESLCNDGTNEFFEFTLRKHHLPDVNNDHQVNLIDVLMLLKKISDLP
ncbi:MAG: hypothetical protein OMM_03940 [Candidatus Magnetoglobus multicellularis str. Araruama]|uniref:Cohesin domain-containing protein n=1 Tax=Candidatus Magnetoglobus multicellularis str. Araruama TaxID=890399 RepID=A0A1V1P3Q6_9BACT|nr:MAG: hypothetical protein OMM_03940 [Candidatus Magnetoglobus multicellularis str. Araruama]